MPAPSDYIIAERTKVRQAAEHQDAAAGLDLGNRGEVRRGHAAITSKTRTTPTPTRGRRRRRGRPAPNVPGRMVIPLPLSEPSHYTPYNEFARGVWILALYPDTTCFYKALVHTPPSQMGGEPPRDYLVEFEDEGEPTGRGEAIRCPQRYVLALPQ